MGVNDWLEGNRDLLAATQAYNRPIKKTPTHSKHKLIITAFAHKKQPERLWLLRSSLVADVSTVLHAVKMNSMFSDSSIGAYSRLGNGFTKTSDV
jgi:hypothetical protein